MAFYRASGNTSGTKANTGGSFTVVDNWITEGAPTDNNEFSNQIEVVAFDTGDRAHGLIRFNGLDAIGAGTVTNAEMGFWVSFTGTDTDANIIEVKQMLRNYVESQVTWDMWSTSNNWQVAGATGALDIGTTQLGTGTSTGSTGYFLTVSGSALNSFVALLCANSVSNYGFYIGITDDTGNNGRYEVFSGTSGDNEIRPYLQFDHAPGATDYPLNAETGSYAVTGVSASTLAGRAVNAETGSYATTGVSASLIPDRSINAETGSYSVTGTSASLITDRLINAETGSYSITGIDASIDFTPVGNYEINAETGSYSITGIDAVIVADRAINAEVGSYSISGIDATLLADRAINAETGSYALSGVDAELLFEAPAGVYTLNAETGSYVITGFDVGFDAPSRALESSGGVKNSFYKRRRIIIEREEEKEEEIEVVVKKVKRLIARKITNKQIAQKVQEQVVEAVQLEFIDLSQAQKLIDDLKQQEILARIRARQLKDDEEAIQFFL